MLQGMKEKVKQSSTIKQWNKSRIFEWINLKKLDTWFKEELKPFTLFINISSIFPDSSGKGKEAFGRREGKATDKLSFSEALVSQVYIFSLPLKDPLYFSFLISKSERK